jgi:hypothetical protein
MNGLEQTFYIMAIIFMSLFFIMFAVLVAAVLVIKAKINRIHDAIESKVSLAASLTGLGTGAKVFKEAKKALKKVK